MMMPLDDRREADAALDERVRSGRERLIEGVTPSRPDPGALRRRRTRQRSVRGALAVGALLVVVAVSVAVGQAGDDGQSVTADRPNSDQPDRPVTASLRPGEFRPMSASPLSGRSTVASIWTGSEVLIWGGENSTGPLDDGAAYDPRTDEWRTLAASPLSARNAPAVVWTGERAIYWGGHGPGGSATRDGAMYDPATDTWSPIADAPIESAGLPQAVWTGDEMIVIAGFNSTDAAIYDPDSDSWKVIDPVPGQPLGHEMRAVWTGNEVVVRAEPRSVGLAIPGQGRARLFAFDPNGGRWRELPAVTATGTGLTSLAWTGDRLLLVSQQPGGAIATLDPQTDQWIGVGTWADDATAAETSIWTGQHLFLWGGGDEAILLDPSTGSTHATSAPGGPERIYPAAVWADGVVVVWGGFTDIEDGYVIRPDAPANAQPETTTTRILTPPDDSEPTGERVPVAGPGGQTGFVDPASGPTEVNGRLLPVQAVYDESGELIGYFACRFLEREVVEAADFDPTQLCSDVTTVERTDPAGPAPGD